ncbi:MAG: hypothetical protein WCD37_12630 [Chloroflexia bacterium]
MISFQGYPKSLRLVLALVLLFLIMPGSSSRGAYAQGDSRIFPETGKTVGGKFLVYWTTHGGLAQQGLPISNEMQEKSDTDGKIYTVQYFERAVFESHPENQPPNDVLLSLLGVFFYKENYPGAKGAPGQIVSTAADVTLFPETGKHVGGLFLDYWKNHGSLAQQGYPISEEFVEVSRLNGQSYKVQYFERAVFEFHPENQPPNDVLLSQLGTFRHKAKYETPPTSTPAPILPTPTLPPAQPTATTVAAPDCSGIPPAEGLTVTPNCAPAGSRFNFESGGFVPGENVGVYVTLPSGQVYGTPDTADAGPDGVVREWYIDTFTTDPQGVWAVTMESLVTQRKTIGYFKVTPPLPSDCSGIPENTTMTVTPNCAPAGTRFMMDAWGFTPGEIVSRHYESPSGIGYSGSSNVVGVDDQGRLATVTFVTFPDDERGVWIAIYEGLSSHHQARGYFKVVSP